MYLDGREWTKGLQSHQGRVRQVTCLPLFGEGVVVLAAGEHHPSDLEGVAYAGVVWGKKKFRKLSYYNREY